MHPPTPFPASSRSRISGIKKEPFLERPARTNAVSRSEQISTPSVRKGDETLTRKQNEKSIMTPNRRYPISSKTAGTKPESHSSITAAYNTFEMFSKRSSYQGSRQTSKSMIVARIPGDKTLPLIQGVTKTPLTTSLQANSFPIRKKVDSAHVFKKAAIKTLRSANYWMEQVKLAEAIEKHAVAMGFFQLAFECDVEPRDFLKEELVAYVERYSLCSDATKQVLICYGIIEDVQESEISTNSDASGVCESPYACNVSVEHSIREQVNESEKRTPLKHKPDAKNANEEIIDIDGSPLIPGHIGAMDVDSLTREVVSCIMSSMDFTDSPSVVESQMCSNVVIASPQSNCLLTASQIGLDSVVEKENMGNSVLYQMESSRLNIDLDDMEKSDLCHMDSCGSKPSVDVCSKTLKEVGANESREEILTLFQEDKKDCNKLISCTLEPQFISLEADNRTSGKEPNISTCLSASSLCGFNLNDELDTYKRNSGVTAQSAINDENSPDISSSCPDNNLKDSTMLYQKDMAMPEMDQKANTITDGETDVIEIQKSDIVSCGAEGESIEGLNGQTLSPTTAVLPKSRSDSTALTSVSSSLSLREADASVQKRGKAATKRGGSNADMAASGYVKKIVEEVASSPDKNSSLDMENINLIVATPESTGLRRSARLRATPVKAMSASQRETNALPISTPRRRRQTPSKV